MDHTAQVRRLLEAGSPAEEWLAYLQRLGADTSSFDTTNRYQTLCSAYNMAFKHIAPFKNKTSKAYAQICINFAKLKMNYAPDDARMFFKYARANIKMLAIVHVEAAQFELTVGDKEKCKDILEKAHKLKAEPTQLIDVAIKRYNSGHATLQSDTDEENGTKQVAAHRNRVLKELPVFHEKVDSTVSFGRSAERVKKLSGTSSSDEADTIPWLYSKPKKNPTAPSAHYISQSVSKLRKENSSSLTTPYCRNQPVSASVGADAKRRTKPTYGKPQRVKRTNLQALQVGVPQANPDDSDDDFPFPDVKPLKEISPPITEPKTDHLTTIVESPPQPKHVDSDSGVSMLLSTPSVVQRATPSLSKAETLRLCTPLGATCWVGGLSTDRSRCRNGEEKGVKRDASVAKPEETTPSESEKYQSVAAPLPQPIATEKPANLSESIGPGQACQHLPPVQPSHVQQHSRQVMAPPNPPGQANKKHDVISVNKLNYNILRVIGRGGSSKVYQVFSEERKKVLAIKHVRLDDAEEPIVEGYINEITLLQKLRNSENIIHLYDYEITSVHIYLVMECGSIDLATFLRKHKQIDPQNMKFYWRGMLDAVDVVHKAGIVHSDLKPANFLFVEGTLKLIDFGIANAIQTDKTSVVRESQVGTLNYMSPEAIQDTSHTAQTDGNVHRRPRLKINCKSDVWSLGCIFYYMVYGKTPFQHISLAVMKLQAICDPRHEINFPAVENPNLLDLLKKCFIRDPHKRPSIEDLRKHPYFQDEAQAIQDGNQASVVNLTEEHLKSLISQLSHAQIQSPRSISAVSRTLLQQFQSGQQLDISTALGSRPSPFQPPSVKMNFGGQNP